MGLPWCCNYLPQAKQLGVSSLAYIPTDIHSCVHCHWSHLLKVLQPYNPDTSVWIITSGDFSSHLNVKGSNHSSDVRMCSTSKGLYGILIEPSVKAQFIHSDNSSDVVLPCLVTLVVHWNWSTKDRMSHRIVLYLSSPLVTNNCSLWSFSWNNFASMATTSSEMPRNGRDVAGLSEPVGPPGYCIFDSV